LARDAFTPVGGVYRAGNSDVYLRNVDGILRHYIATKRTTPSISSFIAYFAVL